MNKGYEKIVTRIQQNDATLTHVNCRQYHLTCNESEKMFKALEDNTHVTHLEYLGNDSSGNAAIALGNMLTKNKTLVRLELGTNQLNNDDIKYIVEGLIHNSSVVVLDVNSNPFTNGEPIAHLLEKNTTLQEIELSNNELSNAEFLKIYTGLVKNKNSSLTNFSVIWPHVQLLEVIESFIENKDNRTGFGCSM